MKIFQVQPGPIAVEAENPQQAALAFLQAAANGKVKFHLQERQRVVFTKKGEGPAGPLTWWPMGKMAQVMCPHGHAITLSEKVHTIRDTGEVTPSLVCCDGCTFHDFIRLEGWS